MFKRKQTKPLSLPTTSLYLQDSISTHKDFGCIDIDRVDDHVFDAGEKAIVVRYASPEFLSSLNKPFVYIIDDDLLEIVKDQHLPSDYRERIQNFLSGPWRYLVENAQEIVVSSEALKNRYVDLGCKVTRLNPYWCDLPKLHKPLRPRKKIRIAWLASRAHARDLDSITDQLAELLNQNPRVQLTVISGKHISSAVQRLPRVRNLKPLNWDEYRKWLVAQSFDMAIHPVLDTPVNQARSTSKWQEVATTGAVPVISNHPLWADWLGESASEYLVNPDQWLRHLATLIDDSDLRMTLSAKAHQIAFRANQSAYEDQVNYWRSALIS